MRKDAGFDVTDHIVLSYTGADDIFAKNEELIASETLCDKVTTDGMDGYSKDWNINGTAVTMTIQKV